MVYRLCVLSMNRDYFQWSHPAFPQKSYSDPPTANLPVCAYVREVSSEVTYIWMSRERCSRTVNQHVTAACGSDRRARPFQQLHRLKKNLFGIFPSLTSTTTTTQTQDRQRRQKRKTVVTALLCVHPPGSAHTHTRTHVHTHKESQHYFPVYCMNSTDQIDETQPTAIKVMNKYIKWNRCF